MDYLSLNNLSNTYPSGSILNPTASVLDAYSTNVDNGNTVIQFSGNSSENSITFNTTSSIKLEDITPVDGTTFRFIIEYGFNEDDTNPIYYTSKPYYDTLVSSSLESNPYYSTSYLNTQTSTIKIFYEDSLTRVNDGNRKAEIRGVKFDLKHVFKTNERGGIDVDFEAYTRYIDWVVSGESSQYDYKYYPIDLISKYIIDDTKLSTGIVETSLSSSVSTVINQIITNRISGVNRNIADLQRQVGLLIQNQQ
jgi:hypothetical protein